MDKKRAERKKRQRELLARQRVMARRQDIREKEREKKREEAIQMAARPRQKPILNIQKSRKEVLANLEKNLKIITEMRDNYLREQETRKQLNQTLEEQGHMTMREKLDAMVEQAHQDITDAKDLWAADDICREFRQNEAAKAKVEAVAEKEEEESKPKKTFGFGGSAEVKVFPRNS